MSTVGYLCRCLQPNELFSKEQCGSEAACSLLCGMRVNSAILKATGAGKSLRGLAKRGLSEEHQYTAGLIQRVIKTWKDQIVGGSQPS